MPEDLNEEIAVELARSLKTIEGFPWDSDTVKATADDLVRWCKGNDVWSAEAQARWLVTQARETWDEWKGTAALLILFKSKFEVQVKLGNEVIDYANEPCFCGKGRKFKDCCQGKPATPFTFEKIKSISAPRPRKGVQSAPNFVPVTQEDIDKELERLRLEKDAS